MKLTVEDIRDLLGSPYKVHGRNKEEGFDCYGLVMEIYKRKGEKLPDFFYDDVKPDDTKEVYNYALPYVEKVDKPVDMCLCCFAIPNESKHIGIYIGEGKMIHAVKNIGVAVTDVKRYSHFFEGYYRFKEMKNVYCY